MPSKRKIIDCETLEIYDSLTELGKQLNVSPARIQYTIVYGGRVKNKKFEYFDEWILLDDKEKELYTYKKNIFFLRGIHTMQYEEPKLKFRYG